MRRLSEAFGGVDRRKAKNILWMFVLQGTMLVSGLVVMTIMARFLGPERLAAYAWVFSLVTLAAPLTVATEPIVTRMLVANPESRGGILGAALSVNLTGATVGATVVISFAAIGGPEGATTMLAVVASVVLFAQAVMGLDSWFRSTERIDFVVIPKALAELAGAAVGLALAVTGAGLAAFIGLRSVRTALTAAASALLYRRRGSADGPRGLHIAAGRLAELVSESWPLIVTGVATVAHLKIDQVMLGIMAPAHELADYAIAARLAEILIFIPVALRAAFYPSLVQANLRDPAGFDTHMQRYYDLHSLAGFSGAVGLVLGSWLLLTPIFGEEYAGGVAMAGILALAVPLQCLVAARDTMQSIRGWTRTILLFVAVSLLVNVTANLQLIPLAGGRGAAMATALSFAVSVVLTFSIPRLRPAAIGLLQAIVVWGAVRRVAALARGPEPK